MFFSMLVYKSKLNNSVLAVKNSLENSDQAYIRIVAYQLLLVTLPHI